MPAMVSGEMLKKHQTGVDTEQAREVADGRVPTTEEVYLASERVHPGLVRRNEHGQEPLRRSFWTTCSP